MKKYLNYMAAGLLAVSGPMLRGAEKPVSVEEKRDVVYLESGRSDKLDLYLPMPVESRRGAVVWIHGGGWAGGKKGDHRELMVSRSLAQEGFVVASIDYQLGSDDQASWPQVLFDCKNAVRYLRSHASELGIDPACIAVAGGSAGAHLALMVAYTSGEPGLEPEDGVYPGVSSEVAAVVELYGITNLLSWQSTDKDGKPTGRPVSGNSQRRLTGEKLPEGRRLWRSASPVSYVRADLPPTFISHGKRDTTVDYLQAVELAESLDSVGARYELILLENTGHTFSLTHLGREPLERDLTGPVTAFLEESFASATNNSQ